MSQKIKPTSLRIGIIRDWTSRWMPKGFRFSLPLQEDHIIRTIINKKISAAGIDSIIIERTANAYRVTVKAAKPGLIIGRGGKGIEELTSVLEKALKKLRESKGLHDMPVFSVNIEEVKRYDVSAQVTAQSIAWDFEKRMPYRRTIKKYLERLMQNRDVKGAKIKVSGRLDGAEIARTEQLSSGSLPLQTLRANIDYAEATSFTTYGTIGVKIWIYKGDVFKKKENA